MKRGRIASLGVLAALWLVGCIGSATTPGTTPSGRVSTPISSPGPSASATQSQAQGAYAILTSSAVAVMLVDPKGKTVATASGASRSHIQTNTGAPPIVMPMVMGSASRAYFLDGDSTVRSLTPSGANSVVGRIPGSSSAEAGFAVSPDDKRIAVSVIDYSRTPPTTRLYVEDLTGANHTELLSSSTAYVWPIAWRAGTLVLAVGPSSAQYVVANPYDAISGYHLVDAANGNRLATICPPPLSPTGAIAGNGTVCQKPDGSVWLAGWDGTLQALPADCYQLSPGGRSAACRGATTNAAPIAPISIFRIGGARVVTPARGSGPLGWVDDEHLIYAAGAGYDADVRLLDVPSGVITPIGDHLAVVGRVG